MMGSFFRPFLALMTPYEWQVVAAAILFPHFIPPSGRVAERQDGKWEGPLLSPGLGSRVSFRSPGTTQAEDSAATAPGCGGQPLKPGSSSASPVMVEMEKGIPGLAKGRKRGRPQAEGGVWPAHISQQNTEHGWGEILFLVGKELHSSFERFNAPIL